MSIRVVVLMLVVTYLTIYAWRKSWFIACCGAVVLMAFVQHEDFPRSVAGIPGLTPWNLLIFSAFSSWLIQRSSQGFIWDAPRGIQTMVLLVLLVGCWATLRLLLNVDDYNRQLVFDEDGKIQRGTFSDFFIEYGLNMLKYALIPIIIFDGCRSRKNVQVALGCVLAFFLFTALQVIKCMPLSALTMSAGELSYLSFKLIQKRTGFSRVTVSMLLSGGAWAMVAVVPLFKKRLHQMGVLALAAATAFGQALTGGRAGYATWILLGVIMCTMKWRKFLLLVPVFIFLVITFMPSVRERMLVGIVGTENHKVDTEEMTSGRATIWPVVIDKIKEQPLFGYGRNGMVISGAHRYISDHIYGESDFAQPHNAYFELLLDCGIFGFFLVMPFYLLMLAWSIGLFLNKVDPLISATGGVAFALLGGLLIASIGSQTLYLSNQSVALWAALAVLVRVRLERTSSDYSGLPLFGEDTLDSSPCGDEAASFEGVAVANGA
jgi:hypothetical protein